MIVTTAQLFQHAYGKYAVGAYNINNAEQAMGLFRGCIKSQAPFIIQISKGARKYTDKRMLEAIILTAEEIFSGGDLRRPLDHGDEETCYDCIESGFYSSVMIDASHYSSTRTSPSPSGSSTGPRPGISRRGRARDAGRREGGHLGRGRKCLPHQSGRSEGIRPAERMRSLACAIGTSHGAHKFKGGQSLHFDVLDGIKKLLPGFPLVMQGGSSVPKEEVARINAAGGKIAGAVGVDENEYPPRRQARGHQSQHRHRRAPVWTGAP